VRAWSNRRANRAGHWHPGPLRLIFRKPSVYWSVSVLAAALCALLVSRAVPEEGGPRLACEAEADRPASSAEPLAADEAAVAVPVDPTTPPVDPGAQVILVLHPDPFLTDTQVSRMTWGRVLTTGSDQLLVAVARDELPAVTASVRGGNASLALAPA
jgi:hypothetical protein